MRKDYNTIYRENMSDYRNIYDAMHEAMIDLLVSMEDSETINDGDFSSIENALFDASSNAESVIDDNIYTVNNGTGWKHDNAVDAIEFALAEWGELYDTYIDFDA